MLAVIRGAGDIATGVALRLWRAHIRVVMTEIERPTAIRRTVCLSQAIVHGETTVEDVTAKLYDSGGGELMDIRFDTSTQELVTTVSGT